MKRASSVIRSHTHTIELLNIEQDAFNCGENEPLRSFNLRRHFCVRQLTSPNNNSNHKNGHNSRRQAPFWHKGASVVVVGNQTASFIHAAGKSALLRHLCVLAFKCKWTTTVSEGKLAA